MTGLINTTYAGLLDDVIHRYVPDAYHDQKFFERSLIKHIFFGGPMLVNDGYLFAGNGLQQAISEGSLLREMVATGFVKILTKAHDFNPDAFASLPEKLAHDGVNTSKNLISSTEWPEKKELLNRWAQRIEQQNSYQCFPRYQMHEGFKRLFNRVRSKSAIDLGLYDLTDSYLDDLLGAILEHEVYETAPRSAIEEVLLSEFNSGTIGKNSMDEMMSIACQAYHYNFALCLSADMKTPIAADTMIGAAFEDLLELPDAVEADIAGMADLPAISVPQGIPLDKPEYFRGLVEPGNSIFDAKCKFLTDIEILVSQDVSLNDTELRKELANTVIEYRSKLAEHFVSRGITAMDVMDGWAKTSIGMVSFVISASSNLLAVATALPSIVKPLLGKKNRLNLAVKKVNQSVSKYLVGVGMHPDTGIKKQMTFNYHEIVPRFTSIGFNDKAVQKHVHNLPKFKL